MHSGQNQPHPHLPPHRWLRLGREAASCTPRPSPSGALAQPGPLPEPSLLKCTQEAVGGGGQGDCRDEKETQGGTTTPQTRATQDEAWAGDGEGARRWPTECCLRAVLPPTGRPRPPLPGSCLWTAGSPGLKAASGEQAGGTPEDRCQYTWGHVESGAPTLHLGQWHR